MAGGFGDMSRRIPTEELDLTPQQRVQQELFEERVHVIFPDGTASRLARACGNVNVRTAQKWLSFQIVPPDDVIEFVDHQHEELERTHYLKALEALVETGTGDLDPEVVASQLGKVYMKIVGSKIR